MYFIEEKIYIILACINQTKKVLHKSKKQEITRNFVH